MKRKLFYLMSALALTILLNAHLNAQEGFYYVPTNWIMDVENPHFLWAQQNDSIELQLGVDSANGSYIMNDNTIKYKNPDGIIEDNSIIISPKDGVDQTISFYRLNDTPEMPNDTILTYNTVSGEIVGKVKLEDNEVNFRLDPYTNKVYNNKGEAVISVGSTVNKTLAVYFVFDFYTRFSRK